MSEQELMLMAGELYGQISAEVRRGGSAVQVPMIAAALKEHAAAEVAKAVAEEREACAKIAEKRAINLDRSRLVRALEIAAAIRERGGKP